MQGLEIETTCYLTRYVIFAINVVNIKLFNFYKRLHIIRLMA